MADLNGDESGLGRMQKALDQYRSAGSVLAKPYAGAWIAEALVKWGDLAAADHVLADTLAFARRTSEAYFDGKLGAVKRAIDKRKASESTNSAEPA